MEKQTVFTREDYNKLSAELNRLKTEAETISPRRSRKPAHTATFPRMRNTMRQ